MTCRVDKFIWSVRLAKTRTKATELINKNKVLINGNNIKPAKEVMVGDEIQIIKHNATFSYKVISTLQKRVGAKQLDDYIIDITPSSEREKLRIYQEAQRSYREQGSGKPTKKHRRAL